MMYRAGDYDEASKILNPDSGICATLVQVYTK